MLWATLRGHRLGELTDTTNYQPFDMLGDHGASQSCGRTLRLTALDRNPRETIVATRTSSCSSPSLHARRDGHQQMVFQFLDALATDTTDAAYLATERFAYICRYVSQFWPSIELVQYHQLPLLS